MTPDVSISDFPNSWFAPVSDHQTRSLYPHCRGFWKFENFTEFETKLANELCDLKSDIYYTRYKANEHHRNLQGLQIATLVLSSITVASLIIFMLYRLGSYYQKNAGQVAL